MPIVQVLFGAVLLFFGRSLYWAFVAVAGLLVGIEFAGVALADQSEFLLMLVAVGAGVLGALLAIFVQRVGFALGGLYAGGYLALNVSNNIGNSDYLLLWFILGAVIGAVAAAVLMDWAIIVLSSFVGAAAVLVTFDLGPAVTAILFVVLAAVGVVVQGDRLRRQTTDQASHS